MDFSKFRGQYKRTQTAAFGAYFGTLSSTLAPSCLLRQPPPPPNQTNRLLQLLLQLQGTDNIAAVIDDLQPRLVRHPQYMNYCSQSWPQQEKFSLPKRRSLFLFIRTLSLVGVNLVTIFANCKSVCECREISVLGPDTASKSKTTSCLVGIKPLPVQLGFKQTDEKTFWFLLLQEEKNLELRLFIWFFSLSRQ